VAVDTDFAADRSKDARDLLPAFPKLEIDRIRAYLDGNPPEGPS
jgi:hypothetical protein